MDHPGRRALVYGTLTSIVVFAGVGMFVKTYVTGELHGDYSWKFWALLIVVALFFARKASTHGRNRREETKAKAEKGLMSGPDRYVLYARPFASEAQIRTWRTPDAFDPGNFIDDPFVTLEESLTRALKKVRVLGGAKEVLGPLRHLTDSEWKETFQRLARAADLIVILPLGGEGTNWELEWLNESNLLRRTLLIMPMSMGKEFDCASRWELSRSHLAQFGVSIPPYDPKGAYLRVQDNGVATSYPLRNYEPNALRELADHIYYGTP